MTEPPPLSSEQISTYLHDGILVVNNMLSPHEVIDAQLGLAATLKDDYGVDVNDLEQTGWRLINASSTNGAGGVLDIFYPEWKMKIATNEKLFAITCQLWKEAYCHSGEELDDLKGAGDAEYDDTAFKSKWHPFGAFDCDKGYMYIDRIGYRIPTKLAECIGKQQHQANNDDDTTTQYIQQQISTSTKDNDVVIPQKKKKKSKARPIQRSLTPHFDCCPEKYNVTANKNKFRPIQCFVSLTDNLEPNTGGFEAVPGFHRDFNTWVANGRRRRVTDNNQTEEETASSLSHPLPCVGEYTHLSPSLDRDIMDRIRHIPVKAGSAVFWDNRIPHGNSYRNDSRISRAVVYCSFLPDVQVNRRFVQRQLEDWKVQRPPRVGDRWIRQDNDDLNGEEDINDDKQPPQQMGDAHSLTGLGKRLIGIEEWQ